MAYTAVYVFGDSLVDSGNALKLAQWYGGLPFTDLPEGAPTEEDGYFKGRFSNGYTFADLVTNKAIGVVTKPIFPYEFEDPWLGAPIAPFASDPNGNNLNFAYGGAHIIQGNEVVPDFDGQTDAFRHAVDFDADPNALYLITTGGNDIRDLAPTGSNPVSQAEAYAALDEAADKLLHELIQLMEIGAHYFAITGIPNVGLIPRYDRDSNGVLDATEAMRSAAATDYSIYLDALIRNEVVPALKALGAEVTYVPLMDYEDMAGNLVIGALNANLATIATIHGLTTEELSQNLLQHKELIFFDHVHPNAQANALLGAYMHSMITGVPWIETLPLATADVDYRMTSTIAVRGEVDKLAVSLVAGTTYTLEMLGVSSLGTSGGLADPSLRLLGPGGNLIGTSSDDGVGFDATLTFTAATSGSYTVELLGTGAPTGFYTVQAAVISGAAMNVGNSYTINSATTIVLEGSGGAGQDVVKAGISYALSEGSEIEVLRTTNDKGKGAINLTGNEFGQTIIGNAGINVLEGKGGSDVLTGRAGSDVFVLSNSAVTDPGAANIDRITDYGSGDTVDISQILNVSAGTNPVTEGYVRVTTSGLIQVDVDGGGNGWVTLSSINNGGAVAVRYVSGGVATTVSVARTSGPQQLAQSAANGNVMLVSAAIAATGLIAAPAAARSDAAMGDDAMVEASALAIGGTATAPHSASPILNGMPTTEVVDVWAGVTASHITGQQEPLELDDASFTGRELGKELQIDAQHSQDAEAQYFPSVATTVGMPSAEMILTPFKGEADRAVDALEGQARQTGEVERILADALFEGSGGPASLQLLLDSLFIKAADAGVAMQRPDVGWGAALVPAHSNLTIEPFAMHPDALMFA